jgi:hypothetical protein
MGFFLGRARYRRKSLVQPAAASSTKSRTSPRQTSFSLVTTFHTYREPTPDISWCGRHTDIGSGTEGAKRTLEV